MSVATIHSASHLLALARGGDCTGPAPCFYCGAPADPTRNPTRVHVKDTFTAYPSVVAPHSDAVCDGCVIAMVDTADITYIDGTMKHMPRAAMRMNSWIVTAGSAVAANKSHLAALRAVCLDPPEPPYAIVLSDKGQAHLIYLARVGRSPDVTVANLEGVVVAYRPAELRSLLDVAGKLAACLGKPGLSEPISVSGASRVFDRYSDAEALIDTWSRESASPLGVLAAWLCPNMEDCKSAYPSDLG